MTISLRQLVIGGSVVWLAATALCALQGKKRRQHSDVMLDEALEASFPSSDPPATQFFDIPVNRMEAQA